MVLVQPLIRADNQCHESASPSPEVLRLAREGARDCGADILLGGILPTLAMSGLSLKNMTPKTRYLKMNRVIGGMR
jgi:hypothetical protein